MIKGSEVNYEEYYATCDECTEEIFVPGLEDANVERIDQAYREKNHLITKKNIEEIMSRYNIDKRPLSKLLGLGELTITRYLDGQLPSQKYSDMLYEICLLYTSGMLYEWNVWRYLKNGRIDFEYTGMACNEYGWWYFTKGDVDLNYTGMACNEYGWWYYSNGRLDLNYTGKAYNQYGEWQFCNGQIMM